MFQAEKRKRIRKTCTRQFCPFYWENNLFLLEHEVKWAFGSVTTNKASGGDRIPLKLFQILKDDAVKVLHSICQQIWKTQKSPQGWKRSVFIPIAKKSNAKNAQTTAQLDSSHTLEK